MRRMLRVLEMESPTMVLILSLIAQVSSSLEAHYKLCETLHRITLV